ncbi:hypothetical protein E2C01_000585 [Portunus trituberculatus]|uniref:Uncharacterized protein n=1 Tax=Portunus trituberculatus TaxID=210409 RepID=A0A5B7CHV5_PORTR|nr:hypothetical protein [Portunus trituberculatus]
MVTRYPSLLDGPLDLKHPSVSGITVIAIVFGITFVFLTGAKVPPPAQVRGRQGGLPLGSAVSGCVVWPPSCRAAGGAGPLGRRVPGWAVTTWRDDYNAHPPAVPLRDAHQGLPQPHTVMSY